MKQLSTTTLIIGSQKVRSHSQGNISQKHRDAQFLQNLFTFILFSSIFIIGSVTQLNYLFQCYLLQHSKKLWEPRPIWRKGSEAEALCIKYSCTCARSGVCMYAIWCIVLVGFCARECKIPECLCPYAFLHVCVYVYVHAGLYVWMA